MAKLAINGGTPVIGKPLTRYNTIGAEEKKAVADVMDSGVLSDYIGAWHEKFMGGAQVLALESQTAQMVGAKHALAVNSATSGLYAAMGAFGVGPGDEVIVPPYTMIASVTSAIVWGAVPVFADLDPRTFCISPDSIRKKITPRTKAIVAVDMFGHPADFAEIMKIAGEHGLKVLEDAAQSPGVRQNGRMTGSLAHAAVYSLNYHKHVHCGEGGIVFTDDEDIARKVSLIRNHAEAVVRGMQVTDLVNMVGQNYRLSELHAAIAIEQYKKLDGLLRRRIELADRLSARLKNIPGLTPPYVQPGSEHAYYVYPITYDAEKMGVSRDLFVKAVCAEGFPVAGGYVKPLYLEPMFQQRIAIGRDGFPFKGSDVSYEKGICPVAEHMDATGLIITGQLHGMLTDEEIEGIACIFEKVAEHIGELSQAA